MSKCVYECGRDASLAENIGGHVFHFCITCYEKFGGKLETVQLPGVKQSRKRKASTGFWCPRCQRLHYHGSAIGKRHEKYDSAKVKKNTKKNPVVGEDLYHGAEVTIIRGRHKGKVGIVDDIHFKDNGDYDQIDVEIGKDMAYYDVGDLVLVKKNTKKIRNNPTPKKKIKEAISGEGWAVGDYTKMLKSATPKEKKVIEHIIDEENEHLDKLLKLHKKNPPDVLWKDFKKMIVSNPAGKAYQNWCWALQSRLNEMDNLLLKIYNKISRAGKDRMKHLKKQAGEYWVKRDMLQSLYNEYGCGGKRIKTNPDKHSNLGFVKSEIVHLHHQSKGIFYVSIVGHIGDTGIPRKKLYKAMIIRHDLKHNSKEIMEESTPFDSMKLAKDWETVRWKQFADVWLKNPVVFAEDWEDPIKIDDNVEIVNVPIHPAARAYAYWKKWEKGKHKAKVIGYQDDRYDLDIDTPFLYQYSDIRVIGKKNPGKKVK